MKQKIAYCVSVNDYDKAMSLYKKWNFTLVEDTVLNDMKRWVHSCTQGSPYARYYLPKL